jgi:predicted secreted protein
MSDAQIGYGSKFLMQATTAATTLTKLAEVTSVSLPNEQIAEVEVTHYESPGRTREYIAGLNDAGELTIGINWIAGKVRTMRVVVPDSTANGQMFTFPGFVRGYERDAPIDDRMTAQITIRIAGAVTQVNGVTDPTVIGS